ncbi:unnamed protein product [Thlaspi arvense]|uniref:UBC core domain-containing protein n=1 Tax=Thlaspi arvense TaxID=13288 RepID=A0AAU9RXW6_THLAR|nr:unnamed protein product [Thlaspi arvense]
MLGNGWAPGFTIPDILMTLWGMLLTPRLDLPDKVNEDTLEYVSNREKFNRKAAEWTISYARK